MCTLTWLRGKDTCELFFNRDEKLARAPESPPRTFLAEGVRYLAPVDGEAGGHWILVNDRGLCLALLNRYKPSRSPRGEFTSRGQLVRSLADRTCVEAALQALAARDLTVFQPFTLLLLDALGAGRILRHDGLEQLEEQPADLGLLTSSSYEEDLVCLARHSLFRSWLERHEVPPAQNLMAFHGLVRATGPDALTPSMRRPDAATRSLTAIRVGPTDVGMAYAAGPPHEVAPGPYERLPRVR